ncbi:MAG: hypothetical protein CVT67_11220 [Actinobacteria bacterium HGW-Actinobacteria-7]|jgi:hypothetical protein|nr:MAG: hypothetical protein CVT67_11220 [Actinobacteria bacterium HGW-Actinobacteria-7]
MLAAAFLLASTRLGDAAEEPVLDTAAAIDQSQCLPCHIDLGKISVPGLVFSHGNHLMVSCDGCHSRQPHRDGYTEHVPMEVCFACHGVSHGDLGELATSKCKDCHTPSFVLRPKDHSKAWASKPHALASAKQGVNGCMMCHRAPKDCDECHAKEAPTVGKMPDGYQTVIQDRPKGPSIKVYPKGRVSMSQCVYCHPDLDAITPGRLIFAHAQHLQRNYPCEACHPAFSHNENGPVIPDMMSCYRCHGLDHAAQGQVATDKCSKCHPKSFKLTPANHTRKFILGTHKKKANKDPSYCSMCHASTFCVGCHRGDKVSPNAPGKPVIPADHRKVDWKSKHGGFFLQGQGACASCHTQQSCKRCHQTSMPHPVGWIENHKPAAGITTDDCNVCHTDRSKCQTCHHATVARAELTLKNCVPCHSGMKKKPATSIKNKGFAEHAVHFNVAKKKGKPYTCDDCHVGFTTTSSSSSHTDANAGDALANAGHDLRLCYGCHGSLDYQNRLIAPYPGAQLCRRCHTDLNI